MSVRDDMQSIAMRKAALEIQRCGLCGRPKYQKHAEVCPGRLQRIADPPEREPDCGCPHGFMHLPDCVLVTGDEAA